jgi:hypothetical protein
MQALGLVWGNIDQVNADLKELRTPIAAPTQHGARLLFDHWRSKMDGPGFVVGRDVPSRALAGVLRNLALYEPIAGHQDFRLRLAGTAFMRRFGRDVTGLKLSEIYDEDSFESHRAGLANVARSKVPELADVKLERGDRTFLRYEALRLPVFSPDRNETWVLCAVFYFDWA